MIPSSLSVVDSLPLTTTGKVDRRALLALRHTSPTAEPSDEPPRDEAEARVAAIWEELLDVRPVGRGRSFFDLGGHSLLAIRMLARIETEFGRAPSIASLLASATISSLAEKLRQPVPSVSSLPLVPLQTEGKGTPFFCVHPAGGIAYCFMELARALGSSRPFYAFQAPGLVDGEDPFGSVEQLARHYAAALWQVQGQGPYHLGGYSLGGSIAPEMAQQLQAAGASVSTLVILDGWVPRTPLCPGRVLLELARRALKLSLFAELIDVQTGEEPCIEDVALLLRSLDSSTFGLRRLLDRLGQRFCRGPAPECTRGSRAQGSLSPGAWVRSCAQALESPLHQPSSGGSRRAGSLFRTRRPLPRPPAAQARLGHGMGRAGGPGDHSRDRRRSRVDPQAARGQPAWRPPRGRA